jgi:hypothetical protein
VIFNLGPSILETRRYQNEEGKDVMLNEPLKRRLPLGTAAFVQALFNYFPVPGQYLSPALKLFRVDLDEIPTPIIYKNPWRDLNIENDCPRDHIQCYILFQGYFEDYESAEQA